ncbi:protein Shroom2-like isoform X2 [Anguilla anguilla]|uniref:protein Shroom2-like isoform X2 n=1 Tax=Anguilla anguilla TaxID=7936 RepID=UPI0015B07F1E|nr:protein Shroom2-like isoform X2 [Anguilla anguilla]
MDAVGHSADLRYTGQDCRPAHGILQQEVEVLGTLEQRVGDSEGCRLVDVLLTGGAPWGFTLRGGREHHEPLLITKVEEGSKAAAVRLQVGDEIVNINEVPLSGYRQEAICLVKGSHKTLALVVRRRSEPVSRPHSWHSTKFTEGQSDNGKAQSTPTAIWHSRYDASSSSTDLSGCWEPANLRRVSDQFSSLGSMDSLEQSPHPYPPGRLSPAKSNNSVEHLGGGGGSKRDSAYSSFSTASSTPDYTLSQSNAASTESMLCKAGQWDSGGRHSNGRHSQSLCEGDRPGYLQLPPGGGGRESPRTGADQPGSRHSCSSSSSGRPSAGPVWHVPEKKKAAAAPSPPPPLPPVRSDSFAVTKVHEKGLVIPYAEEPGPLPLPQAKPLPQGPENVLRTHLHVGERGPDSRLMYSAPHKADRLHPYAAADPYSSNNGQFTNSNKLYSLSSSDVRLGQAPYAYAPHRHQRQYSDESTFYMGPRLAAAAPRPPGPAGGYYSSMQELPTNSHSQGHGPAHTQGHGPAHTQGHGPAHTQGHGHAHTQGRNSSTSLSAAAADPNADGHSRYYCLTARQPPGPVTQATLVKVEEWKGGVGMGAWPGMGAGPEAAHTAGARGSATIPQKAHKAKNPLPLAQQAGQEGKDSNGIARRDEAPPLNRPASAAPKPGPEERGGQRRASGPSAEPNYMSYPPSKHSGACQQRHAQPQRDPWLSRDEGKICPQTTPMLHSLSQEGAASGPEPRPGEAGAEEGAPQGGKQVRRSDRFATTLRNEIQLKRAQLQKSRSAATLTGPCEAEEDEAEPEAWRPGPAQASAGSASASASSDGSFGGSYKDHLKEAQARVLQATSFRRRDLEPAQQEAPAGAEGLPPPALQGRPAPPPAGAQVSRIGGRKRFSAEKRLRSFSEPDKINEVGVEEEPPRGEAAGSFADRRNFFEATGRPAFPKPAPRQAPRSSPEDPGEPEPESGPAGGPEAEPEPERDPARADGQAQLEQQRLGTFAEYEATWNVQRKASEARPSGRYHSADNILDPGAEERSKPSYVHERSRSSPSADFYGENVPIAGRKSAGCSPTDPEPAGQEKAAPRVIDGASGEPREREATAQRADGFLAPPLGPAPTQHHHHPDPGEPRQAPPPGPRKKGPAPLRPPPPKLDRQRRPESSSPLSDSQESLLGAPDGQAAEPPPLSPGRDSPGAPPGEVLPKPEPPALPSSSPAAPSASHMPASLLQPSMDGPRSPSPQFVPQRLTDRPPVSLQEDTASSQGQLSDSNPAVRKVPVKIVHQAESSAEREAPVYPPQSEAHAAPPVASLGSSEPSYSLFCTYTRPREDPALEPEPAAPQEAQSPQAVGGATSEEDRKREELARDILGRDKSLADILDQTKMKTTMDLMEGIFPQGEQLLEGAQQRRKVAPKQTSPKSNEERREEDSLAASVALVTSSSYYSTSAPKAELLIKMKDMQEQIKEQDSEDELDIDLANKKQELIDSLSRKLQVLREARESLLEDIQENNALGDEVEATVQQVCKPNELDKFRMFAGDLDKVVSLLLSLSGRLARVENALNTLEEGAAPGEKRTLTEKRKLLIRQHEDAKELKENLDRRERVVYDILASYLDEERLADYEHFVKMKSALIIEQRKLEDKIKLGEEQLKCLMDSLPLEQRVPF